MLSMVVAKYVSWSYPLISVEKCPGETNTVSMKHDKHLMECFARGCIGRVRLMVKALGSFFTIPIQNDCKTYEASYPFGTEIFRHYKMAEHHCFHFSWVLRFRIYEVLSTFPSYNLLRDVWQQGKFSCFHQILIDKKSLNILFRRRDSVLPRQVIN